MSASDLPRLGVRLPNSGPFAQPDTLLETAQLAEQLGYSRVWLHDHISWPREQLTHFATGSLEACADQDPNFFESVSTSALLLGRLQDISVGIAGLVLPLRDPRVLGKQLGAINDLGGRRLLVAVGIGAIRGDFEVMGVPFKKRGRITNDKLSALKVILGSEHPVSFDGDTLSFIGGTFLPAPNAFPIWVTGSSEPGLRRVVRFADGWLTVYKSVDEYRQLTEQLDDLADASGRDPASIDRGYETFVCVGDSTEEAVGIAANSLEGKFHSIDRGREVAIVGDPAETVNRIREYGDAGAAELEMKFLAHDVGQLRRMMESVAEVTGLAGKETKN